MPRAAKSNDATSNGAAPKAKSQKPAASTNGTSTPVPETDKDAASTTSGKPDKAAYDAEQEQLKKNIDALQTKLNSVRDKISSGGKGGPADDRRSQLRAEFDTLRSEQTNGKASRGKLLDQLKLLNENVQRKVKDLNAARGKIPYKTVGEIDERIKTLEKQIESGNMKLAEEKRALQEISKARGSRRTVESFQKEQDAIDADRAAADDIKKQLDDPEAKAVDDRFKAIKAELDAIKKEGDEAYANRNKLFDERNAIQAELDSLFGQKRAGAQAYREANDRYWAKVNEDRARRAERARTQRAEEEAEKKKAIAERIREEATAPAYQAQIEDCQTLVDYFSGKSSAPAVAAALAPRAEVVGVPKLEPRAVEALGDGVIVRKKKGEDEEAYFAGKAKGKKGGKKGGAKAAPADAAEGEDTPASATSQQLNIPFPTLSALLSLSIPPPAAQADVPRVIEDLKTKKAWFEANQKRQTEENIAKAEKEIERLTGGNKGAAAASENAVPPNGDGEKPAEPTHTPAVADVKSTPVPSEEVVEKLESVQESEA